MQRAGVLKTRWSPALALATIALATLIASNAFAAYTLSTLHGFCQKPNCADGAQPQASLLMDGAGNLYGTTLNGGAGAAAPNHGTIFVLAFDGTKFTYQVLYNFCAVTNCADGYSPYANLIRDKKGNLYGTAQAGGKFGAGVVFELVKGTKWKFQKVYDFCKLSGCEDGRGPIVGLTYAGQASGALYDGASPLYGTTSFGGAHSAGVAFRLALVNGAWQQKVLHDFCSGGSGCPDGSVAHGITADANGNLFGVTEYGGNPQNGVLYRLLRKKSYAEQVLYAFCQISSCADGASPVAAPAFDSKARVIGTTYGGGHGHGVVYRYEPGSSQFTVLHDFCVVACTDGDQPQAGVVLDVNGNIYGTTVFGGANCADQIPHGCGVVWRLQGSKFAVLHSFCDKKNCADGGRPYGGVILDASGDVFGTTSFGGPYVTFTTAGTVFKLSP